MSGGRLFNVVLAVLTFWSPIFIVVFAYWLFQSPLLSASGREAVFTQESLVVLALEVIVAIVLNIVTLVVLAVTTVFYGAHILRNTRLSEGKKVAWSLVNATVGPFAMPLYWFLYVQSESQPH